VEEAISTPVLVKIIENQVVIIITQEYLVGQNTCSFSSSLFILLHQVDSYLLTYYLVIILIITRRFFW